MLIFMRLLRSSRRVNAPAAGYSFHLAPRPLDYDGIDAIIAGRDETNLIRYPRLESKLDRPPQKLPH